MTNLEEIFDSFSVVTIGLTANTLDFFDLTSFAGGLNVLKVDFRILAEVDNRSQKVEQSLEALQGQSIK